MTTFVFCRGCGKQIHETAQTCPSCGAPQAVAGAAPPGAMALPVPNANAFAAGGGMDLSTSIKTCFAKYVVWQGRASRSEFWYFELFNLLVTIPLAILSAAVPDMAGAFSTVSTLFSLAIFLPGLSVTVRRLHDTDRSGWWFWLACVPIIGTIIVIVWLCTVGTAGDNTYGPDPLR